MQHTAEARGHWPHIRYQVLSDLVVFGVFAAWPFPQSISNHSTDVETNRKYQFKALVFVREPQSKWMPQSQYLVILIAISRTTIIVNIGNVRNACV